MKRKKLLTILTLVAIVVLILAFGAIGTNAWFVDQETSKDNVFAAGTLDLKVDGKDDPEIVSYAIGPLKPGDSTIGPGAWATGALYWKIKNVGNIPGKLTVKIMNVVNYENEQNEPEALVDPTAGDLQGELGSKLHIQVWRDGIWTYEVGNLNATNNVAIIPGFKPDVILGPNEETTLQISWGIADTVGNEIQSDSVKFDVAFLLEQN